MPFMECWHEMGQTFYSEGATEGKTYSFAQEKLREISLKPPDLQQGWNGVLKRRMGQWWFLRFERGVKPQEQVSSLYRYQSKSKEWMLSSDLSVRVSNFEILRDDEVVLFGVHSPIKGAQYLAATVRLGSGDLTLLDPAPIGRQYADWFWKACVTSVDDQMASAYFPRSGHLVGFDRATWSLRTYKTPWVPVTDDVIAKSISAAVDAKKADCYISLTDHPGARHCYFIPISPGQMAFVYQILDEEMAKDLPKSPDGSRPIVERVSAFTMYSSDSQTIELNTPARLQLDRWCWSSRAGRLVPMKDRFTSVISIDGQNLTRAPGKRPIER